MIVAVPRREHSIYEIALDGGLLQVRLDKVRQLYLYPGEIAGTHR